MKLKNILISLVILLTFLPIQKAQATTTANTFRITTDGSQQKDPIVYQNIVAYDSLSDIWAYNFDTHINYPLVQRDGEQYITGFYQNLVIYENLDTGSNVYQIRMRNIQTGDDSLIAGGSVSYTGGVTNGKVVAYIEGFACGHLHVFNLESHLDQIIFNNTCVPVKISGNTIVFPSPDPNGTNIKGYNVDNQQLFDISTADHFQENANIYQNKVVWLYYLSGSLGDYNSIILKDLTTGVEKTIYESSTSTLQWPAVSNNYIIWSESTAQHVNGVKGYNLTTGEVFEIQPQGSHQNSHTSPSIWDNTAVWMSWRTGNGDIYGSILNDDTAPSTFFVNSSYDDVNETNGFLSSIYGPFYQQLWFGNDGPGVDSWTGVRFNNINIPKGSIINSAKLQVYNKNDQWVNTKIDIFGELIPNSASFSNEIVPSKRNLTIQKFTHNSSVKWLGETWNDWGEIKNIIQEIIDQPNWQSGNSISILTHGVGNSWGRKFVSSFDDNPSLAPQLLIALDSSPKPILVGAALGDYSPPTGDNCNINVPSQFSTIQAGINAATNGDTICVSAGTYNEDVLINKSIRLSGKGALKSVISGQDPNTQGAVAITADNVTLEGFLINGIGTSFSQTAVAINGSDSGSVSEAIVQHNRVVAGNGEIALRTIRVQNSIIQNNILEGNNSPFVAALGGLDGVGSANNSFINNTFIGTVSAIDRQDTGITLDAATPYSLVKQNVFNTSGGLILVATNNTSIVNENNFDSSTSIKVASTWGTPSNAENNWWGDLDPSDNVQGNVDYTPLATSPFVEN